MAESALGTSSSSLLSNLPLEKVDPALEAADGAFEATDLLDAISS
jgi:hypothetical protein